jgi:hypothetical protein
MRDRLRPCDRRWSSMPRKHGLSRCLRTRWPAGGRPSTISSGPSWPTSSLNPERVAASTTGGKTGASADGPGSWPMNLCTEWSSGWDISLQWELEPDPAKTSEVEVRFIPEGPDQTRVELEHRAIDRHGDGWEQMRDAVSHPEGGAGVLASMGRPMACSARLGTL